MSATPVPSVTALGTPPSSLDVANFDARADSWNASIPTFSTQIQAVANNVVTNANFAEAMANASDTSRANAVVAQGIAQGYANDAANSAAAAAAAVGTNGTSTTSLALSAGSKTFTMQTGKSLVPGMRLDLARTSDPYNSRMSGIITAYNTGTGSTTFTVDYVFGSGTFTDWTISLGARLATTALPKQRVSTAITLSAGIEYIIAANVDLTLPSAPGQQARIKYGYDKSLNLSGARLLNNGNKIYNFLENLNLDNPNSNGDISFDSTEGWT